MAWNSHRRTLLAAAPAVLVTSTLLAGMHDPPDESTQYSPELSTESTQPSRTPQPSRGSQPSFAESTRTSQPPATESTQSSQPWQPAQDLSTESTQPSRTPTADSARQSRFRQRILELTNRARARAGCPKVRLDPTLSRTALEHSRDMARHDFLAHTGSAGFGHIERARAAGYRSSYVGENVAVGNNTAEETFRQWMTSPEHRANILNCSFTELGVGYVRDPSGEWENYWTQNLGRPAESEPTPSRSSEGK
ncbi:CAP domain-containing protein [Haloactinomyces albus]|uniref:Uncharacterized protein YkwD n=1 Tax=Haloactinomyces albus TaxID=1352928 RepID=A0AAE4CMX4_9ACTN|nr:CAP domain-containing protein [Haloactinomyces albus]MDR7302861.1 uncharacterized protein YkwD [Haloactinomyces albus]